MYKSVVVKFDIKAKSAAQAIDARANEMEEKGLQLVSVAFLNECKAVATFAGDAEHVEAYNAELAANEQERQAQRQRDKADAKAWHDQIKAEAKARKEAKDSGKKDKDKKKRN